MYLLHKIWQSIKDFKQYLLGINTVPLTGPAGLLHVLKGKTWVSTILVVIPHNFLEFRINWKESDVPLLEKCKWEDPNVTRN